MIEVNVILDVWHEGTLAAEFWIQSLNQPHGRYPLNRVIHRHPCHQPEWQRERKNIHRALSFLMAASAGGKKFGRLV